LAKAAKLDAVATVEPNFPLDMKLKPSQARARNTFEVVLSAASELLGEVGFERLSTNMVCERAGLTPPALYRYFPNKYAILSELARRLMEVQDEIVFEWMKTADFESASLDEAVRSNVAIILQVNAVTRAQPGGVWILRALRAVPLLHAVRIESRNRVAAQLADILALKYPNVDPQTLQTATRMTTELTYAATEMVLQEPDQLEEERIITQASRMMALYYDSFRKH
jgi:AcrR family transcriptional regulator